MVLSALFFTTFVTLAPYDTRPVFDRYGRIKGVLIASGLFPALNMFISCQQGLRAIVLG